MDNECPLTNYNLSIAVVCSAGNRGALSCAKFNESYVCTIYCFSRARLLAIAPKHVSYSRPIAAQLFHEVTQSNHNFDNSPALRRILTHNQAYIRLLTFTLVLQHSLSHCYSLNLSYLHHHALTHRNIFVIFQGRSQPNAPPAYC